MTADEKLTAILAEHGKTECPSCGKKIDRADVAWNNADTEAGTPFTWVEIQCLACQTEIIHFSSWYPAADDLDDLIEHVLPDWR